MPSATEPPPAINPWIVAVAVMFATFMEVLDTTVVNVSLPHIAGSLSVSTDEAAWALTSYLVANAIILPMTGWIANYFVRKRTFLAAVFGFTAARFLCGLATSLPMLILFRVMQGATGGALLPLSQAFMLEAIPPQDRGKAMAFWGLGIVVAPMLGPVIGGYLTDNFSWRWVFYINLPVGLASVIMTRLFIFDPPYIRRQKRGIDYWGIGMLALGVGALQVILDKGQEDDWFAANWIVIATLVSAAALILFVGHEMHTGDPVVHLPGFKDPSSAGAVAGDAFCAPDHGHDGPHPQGRDGERHQHVQPDAQSGRRFRNRRGDHIPVPPPAIPYAPVGRTREHVELADPGVLQEYAERNDDARRGPGGGRDAILCRAMGHGAAASGDAGLRGHVPGDGDRVPAGAAVPLHHAKAEAPPGRRPEAFVA